MTDDYDPFYISSDTDVEEVLEFVRDRLNDARVIEDEGENVVWNFSSYSINDDALKLGYREEDKFVIPYQVNSVWAFMYSLLPEELREAEILIWREDREEYIAYQQFYRQLSPERREQLRYSFAQRVDEVLEE